MYHTRAWFEFVSDVCEKALHFGHPFLVSDEPVVDVDESLFDDLDDLDLEGELT